MYANLNGIREMTIVRKYQKTIVAYNFIIIIITGIILWDAIKYKRSECFIKSSWLFNFETNQNCD